MKVLTDLHQNSVAHTALEICVFRNLSRNVEKPIGETLTHSITFLIQDKESKKVRILGVLGIVDILP